MGLVAALLIPAALAMQPLSNLEEGKVVFNSDMAITSSTDTRGWVANDFAADEGQFFHQLISTCTEKLAHLLRWNHGEIQSDFIMGNNAQTVVDLAAVGFSDSVWGPPGSELYRVVMCISHASNE
jgi:hypothetical protein